MGVRKGVVISKEVHESGQKKKKKEKKKKKGEEGRRRRLRKKVPEKRRQKDYRLIAELEVIDAHLSKS